MNTRETDSTLDDDDFISLRKSVYNIDYVINLLKIIIEKGNQYNWDKFTIKFSCEKLLNHILNEKHNTQGPKVVKCDECKELYLNSEFHKCKT